MTKYVVGFIFSPGLENVLLIRKNRPSWQSGKLNGIGGHIEARESPIKAIRRECLEEAGLKITNWFKLCNISSGTWEVTFFYAFFCDLSKSKSLTDENLVIIDSYNIPEDVISNLKWLIPLALYKIEGKGIGENIKISN